MTHPPHSTGSTRSKGLVYFAIASLAMSAACPNENKNVSETKTQAVHDSVEKTKAEHDTIVDPRLASFCNRQGWVHTCKIPEYTDDQRLSIASNKEAYGPVVKTIPAEGLEARVDSTYFKNIGDAVAMINVDTVGPATALPSTYQNLGLTPGFNCVYIGYTAATNTWKAYLTIPGAGNPPCAKLSAPPPPPSSVHNVVAVANPHFYYSDSVPAVSRFHEGRMGNGEQPLFGVKCGKRWCILLPAGADTLPPHLKGVHTEDRRWSVHGWSDSQHLSVAVSPGQVKRGSAVGSVIPGPAAMYQRPEQYLGAYRHAATVFFRGPPPADYAAKWGFGEGENEIQVKNNGDGTWMGQTVHHGAGCPDEGCKRPLFVTWTDHNFHMPAVARFLWNPNDEGIWVRCADGCCKVTIE